MRFLKISLFIKKSLINNFLCEFYTWDAFSWFCWCNLCCWSNRFPEPRCRPRPEPDPEVVWASLFCTFLGTVIWVVWWFLSAQTPGGIFPLPFPAVESGGGHPHSSCLLSAAARADRCFSINWHTMVSTVSAVCTRLLWSFFLYFVRPNVGWLLTEISSSLLRSGSSSLKTAKKEKKWEKNAFYDIVDQITRCFLRLL